MSSNPNEFKQNFVVVNAINQHPISFNMTFSNLLMIVARINESAAINNFTLIKFLKFVIKNPF